MFGLCVLLMIIFVIVLILVLYYIGVMKWIVVIFGVGFVRVLGVSCIEVCLVVVMIFFG